MCYWLQIMREIAFRTVYISVLLICTMTCTAVLVKNSTIHADFRTKVCQYYNDRIKNITPYFSLES